MKPLSRPSLLLLTLAAASGPVLPRLLAYPPAPHHVIEGVVRDTLGNPLRAGSARIILEATSGTQVTSVVSEGQDDGLNYEVTIPMDAGLTSDLYRPTALQPFVPFKIKVRLGTVTYLPIQMKGNYANLGMPGQRTRLDLTLGEDSDGDGLPDAWERALIQMLGGNLTLTDIRPGDDSDADGLSNLDEYLAGTYAFDPAHGFELAIVANAGHRAELEFTAIRGRGYTIYVSEDMNAWTPVSFVLPGDAPEAAGRATYVATDTRLIKARVSASAGGEPTYRFFKLEVR